MIEDTIANIIQWHRDRCFWMEQRKRSDLSLGSYVRTRLGWSLALPKNEREAIRAQAEHLLDLGEKYVKAIRKSERKIAKLSPANLEDAQALMPEMPADLAPYAGVIVAQIEMRRKTDELEADTTRQMEALAKSLPIYPFVEQIKGLGPIGLAVIVGEAGDLSAYATHSKLWKRLGLAVIGDKRQGGLSKTAPKEEWIKHGYSRKRRSRIYTIGAAMVKVGDHYRQIYLDRKAYEVARAEADGLIVAPSAKIPEKRKNEYRSLGHIDNRARRYMEKKLIRDLWNAWRRAPRICQATRWQMPVVTLLEAAD